MGPSNRSNFKPDEGQARLQGTSFEGRLPCPRMLGDHGGLNNVGSVSLMLWCEEHLQVHGLKRPKRGGSYSRTLMLLNITVLVILLVFRMIPVRVMLSAPFSCCVEFFQIASDLVTALAVLCGVPIDVSLCFSN